MNERTPNYNRVFQACDRETDRQNTIGGPMQVTVGSLPRPLHSRHVVLDHAHHIPDSTVHQWWYTTDWPMRHLSLTTEQGRDDGTKRRQAEKTAVSTPRTTAKVDQLQTTASSHHCVTIATTSQHSPTHHW